MLKQLMFIATMFFSLQAQAEPVNAMPDTQTPTTEAKLNQSNAYTVNPEALVRAKSVVNAMTEGKSPEEILGMAEEIALALSAENLCGLEDIQAMMDVGIPFDVSFDAVVKACNFSGPELAALNRSIAPGLSQGTGGEVSP